MKKVRPAEEELTSSVILAAFVILWYAMLYRFVRSGEFGWMLLIFAVAGLFPLAYLFRFLKKVLAARAKRKEAIRNGTALPGRITGAIARQAPASAVQVGSRTQICYVLRVEVVYPETQMKQFVETQAYRKPVHLYLASDQVTVYVSPEGWEYYLEDLQYKKHRKDPGPFSLLPGDFSHAETGSVILLAVLIIWIFISLIWG